MAYSRAYQTVTAGRVREDEAIAFYGKNRIATPVDTFSIVAQGSSKQPSLKAAPLEDVNVGKKDNRASGSNAYLENPYNAASA